MISDQVESVQTTSRRHSSTTAETNDLDLWRRKYQGLKRRCNEYQEMNNMLFVRAKKINQMIETAETETRYLVKKLEQYEEIDFPKCLPSVKAEANGFKLGSHDLPSPSASNHKMFYAAAAARIRSEVDLALSHEGISTNDVGTLHPNRAHCAHGEGGVGTSGPLSNIDRSSSQSQTPYQDNYLQSQSPVVQGPPRLIHAASPIAIADKAGPTRAKKFKKTLKRAPEKRQKSAAASKRRKGEIDPNAPKKPSNAFFWFCQARRAGLQEKFKGEGVTGQHDLTKALAKLWGETNTEDKKPFYEQYAVDKARYDHQMEEYAKMKQAMASSLSVPAVTNQIVDEGTFSVTITAPEI